MPKANRHKDDPGRLFRAAIPTPKPATTPIDLGELRRSLCGGFDRIWGMIRPGGILFGSTATSAHLNWGENWKSQRSDKLSKAYNAIEEAFPETRRFKGQWAIDHPVKQFWDNHKTYWSCVKQRVDISWQASCRPTRRRATSPRTSPSLPARTSPISPTPGPLWPRRRPPINSDDDDDDDGQGEDVFQPASDEDTEHNGGDEGED
ncbi:hypothetical protein B0H14DRAFT_3179022 [Mycena olivaceomarginata]|nr:hypothetical protein B0H14DRAFT_3179022 [Mycena olivaceomarginata]